MESVVRDVSNIESDERWLYESVLGHKAARGTKRVIIRVVDMDRAIPTTRAAGPRL